MGALSEVTGRPPVLCPKLTNNAFCLMLEVEPTASVAIWPPKVAKIIENILKAEKKTKNVISILKIKRDKAIIYYYMIGSHRRPIIHLPSSSLLPNTRKGPKLPSTRVCRFTAIGCYRCFTTQGYCKARLCAIVILYLCIHPSVTLADCVETPKYAVEFVVT